MSLLPLPQGNESWDAWAQRLVAALEQAVAGSIVGGVPGGGGGGGGTAPTFYDNQGRIVLNSEGLWIWDPDGQLPIAPNIFQLDTRHIIEAAIKTAQIADDAVTDVKIKELAVKTAHIADAAIIRSKIGDLEVGTAQIDDLAVNRAKIANAAVGSAQIDDLAVTRAKIALLAVGSAQIDDLAVVNAKIANLAVTNAKIDDFAVTNAKISGDIQSDTWGVPGQPQWKIEKATGNATFSGVVISRDIVLASDHIVIGPYGQMDGVEVGVFEINTNVATSAWNPNAGPLAASAGFAAIQVEAHPTGGTSDSWWEARVLEVYSRTNFTATATIWLRVQVKAKWNAAYYFDGTSANPAAGFWLTWTLYDVT